MRRLFDVAIIAAVVAFFAALSAVAMPPTPTVEYKTQFFHHQKTLATELTRATFAARAPPTSVPNVAVTGDVTVMHGGAFVTHGVKTLWASLNFGADHIAPNNVGGTNIRAVDPSVANAGDRLPPYNPNAPIRDFDADGTTTYVRVYTEGQTGQQGSWMMRSSDIEGLSPQQIQDRFDLPYAPTHVTD